VADPRIHLADLRYALAALESATELLHCNENHEDKRFATFCVSTSRDAGQVAKRLRKKVLSMEK
jgi:hypothetical protein